MKSQNHSIGAPVLALLASVSLAGCIGENFQRGYVPSATALQQVTVGAPREQVLIVLGTPSTTAELGGEVFYYISQTTNRPVRFMNSRVIDQKVLAVYFDESKQVTQVANYGLQDGRIFDFIERQTPTSGADRAFLSQLFRGLTKYEPFGSGSGTSIVPGARSGL